MPIYEYSCKSCGKQFEQYRSSNSEYEDSVCPLCGENTCKRIMSQVNFYITPANKCRAKNIGSPWEIQPAGSKERFPLHRTGADASGTHWEVGTKGKTL